MAGSCAYPSAGAAQASIAATLLAAGPILNMQCVRAKKESPISIETLGSVRTDIRFLNDFRPFHGFRLEKCAERFGRIPDGVGAC